MNVGKKLSTTKRIKCKCGKFVRENLMKSHKCTQFSDYQIEKIVERQSK